MQEEKKIVELNDQQLEKVSGGKEQIKGDPKGEYDYTRGDGACGQMVIVNTYENGPHGKCKSYNQTNPICVGCKYQGNSGNSGNSDDDPSGGKYENPFH